METTQTNEALNESAKLTEKWFKDTSEAMTDIYNKQMSLALGIYNNWTNAWMGAGKNQVQQPSFNSLFGGADLGRWSFFAGLDPTNTYFAWLDRTWKQTLDHNREAMSFLNDTAKSNTNNWEEYTRQYRHLLEKRFEAASETLNAMTENYQKLLNTSFDDYQKIASQANKQLVELVKQNEAFWTEAIKPFGTNNKQEKSKDLIPVETRKKVSAVAA